MTHTIVRNGSKTMQSIMQNRGNKRIWLQDLAAYGWYVGKAYKVVYDKEVIVIYAVENSKRSVGKSKNGIIDLCNKSVTAFAERTQATHVNFAYFSDRIVISVAKQFKQLEPMPKAPREADTSTPPSNTADKADRAALLDMSLCDSEGGLYVVVTNNDEYIIEADDAEMAEIVASFDFTDSEAVLYTVAC